ncbi:unnamed protein product [Prorocentrum cordatum]|uniref:Uncharacterized protein n=1 Tax=Prorocentrum cordatum TaxID=2364126 RepID=A0ABN9YH27_9DINO|nr:unnamed protein product [Polarella glacialis]
MVVHARLRWLRDQIVAGVAAHLTFGAAAFEGRGKVKVVLDPARPRTSPTARAVLLSAASALEEQAGHAVVVDRGHRFSDGRAEAESWVEVQFMLLVSTAMPMIAFLEFMLLLQPSLVSLGAVILRRLRSQQCGLTLKSLAVRRVVRHKGAAQDKAEQRAPGGGSDSDDEDLGAAAEPMGLSIMPKGLFSMPAGPADDDDDLLGPAAGPPPRRAPTAGAAPAEDDDDIFAARDDAGGAADDTFSSGPQESATDMAGGLFDELPAPQEAQTAAAWLPALPTTGMGAMPLSAMPVGALDAAALGTAKARKGKQAE